MHRSGTHLVAATALAFTLALSATGPAMALGAAAPGARLTVEPGSGPPTARVTAAGRGFAGGEHVAISFDAVHLADATAAGDGSFSLRVEIPRAAFPGRHEVEADGQASDRSATTRFLVRTDWYQGEFDAAHTVHNPYENVLAPWNVGRLLQAWVSPVGFGTTYASPIVVGGRVFLGATDHRMHAFDALTGAELWAGPRQESFFVDSAASAHGLVFASALYKRLRAYDADTGHVVWSDSACRAGVRASPTVVGHVLYLACFDGTLYALDTDTGDELWSAPGPCCVFDQSPAVDGGRVFQMRTAHTLTAYDAATGAELWHRPAFAVGTVAAAHGTLFYGYYPDVVALDEATGALRWKAPVFSCRLGIARRGGRHGVRRDQPAGRPQRSHGTGAVDGTGQQHMGTVGGERGGLCVLGKRTVEGLRRARRVAAVVGHGPLVWGLVHERHPGGGGRHAVPVRPRPGPPGLPGRALNPRAATRTRAATCWSAAAGWRPRASHSRR